MKKLLLALLFISLNANAAATRIKDSDIDPAASIQLSKLAAVPSGEIVVGNGSNVATPVTPSGGVTMDNTGVFGLSNASVIGQVLTGFVSGAGTVSATDSILAAIQKIVGNIGSYVSNSLTSGKILVGNGSNVAAAVSVGGDCTISNTGSLTCTKTNGSSFGTAATQNSTAFVQTAAASTVTQAGASSAPATAWSGNPYSGGNSTTNKYLVGIEWGSPTSTAWSTAGTAFGINAASGFTGNLFDYQYNGTSIMSLSGAGQMLLRNINDNANWMPWCGQTGSPSSSANCIFPYVSNAHTFKFMSINAVPAALAPFQMDLNYGNITLGGGAVTQALADVYVEGYNYSHYSGQGVFGIQEYSGQTRDNFDIWNNLGSVLVSMDYTGRGTFAHITDTEFGTAGIVHNSSSGSLTSSALTVADMTIQSQTQFTCTTSSTIDWSQGNVATMGLTNSDTCAVTFSNAKSGQTQVIQYKQPSSTGSGAVSYSTTIKWPAGVTPSMTTGGSAIDVCTFVYDGTNYYGSCLQNFQ